jgi:hypothetical protein
LKAKEKSEDYSFINSQKINSKKRYLPIDAYDPLLDEEDSDKIIEDYRDPETGYTLAQSKWFFSAANIIDTGEKDNHFEMRQCQVIRYIKSEELYEVRWLCNGAVKKVSRFNLIFLRED